MLVEQVPVRINFDQAVRFIHPVLIWTEMIRWAEVISDSQLTEVASHEEDSEYQMPLAMLADDRGYHCHRYLLSNQKILGKEYRRWDRGSSSWFELMGPLLPTLQAPLKCFPDSQYSVREIRRSLPA